MHTIQREQHVQTIIVGGGQAGLAVGYNLAKRGLPFLILDKHERVGDAWRNRWDSLRLFTPARNAGLPGLSFPARGDVFPTKEQMADYLEAYATRFQLPVRTGVEVESLTRDGDRYLLRAGGVRYEAEHVVVAMSNYQAPQVPSFAADLGPDIVQLHSHDYRNPSQLQPGGVLVVGVGNSGADIGIEVARTHRTWLSGKESGHVPFPIDSVVGRFVLVRVVRFVGHHVLSVSTPIGRKVRPKLLGTPAPLVRVKPAELLKAGIERVARVVGVRDGLPLLADGQTIDARNVIWCTGYRHGFPWIELPIFDDHGEPAHERGIVRQSPGLYFVGLHFLTAMSSATLFGIGRDAARIADAVAARVRATQAA